MTHNLYYNICCFCSVQICRFKQKNGNKFALFWKRAFQFGNKKSKIHLFCPKIELIIFHFAKKSRCFAGMEVLKKLSKI